MLFQYNNIIRYNMIQWHEWIFTNVWSIFCHFNPPSAHHNEVTKNHHAIFVTLPGEFGHASTWFLCPGTLESLMPYMAHGVSPVLPKVDVVSLDSGEASLAAGPPRPEALWKFFLEGKVVFEDLRRSEGSCSIMSVCFKPIWLWFKMIGTTKLELSI